MSVKDNYTYLQSAITTVTTNYTFVSDVGAPFDPSRPHVHIGIEYYDAAGALVTPTSGVVKIFVTTNQSPSRSFRITTIDFADTGGYGIASVNANITSLDLEGVDNASGSPATFRVRMVCNQS